MGLWRGHLSFAGRLLPDFFRPNALQCLHGIPSAQHTEWIYFTAVTGGLMKEQACIKQLEEPSHFCWGNTSAEWSTTAVTPLWLPSPWLFLRQEGQFHSFSRTGSAPCSTQIACKTLETYFSCLPWLPGIRNWGYLSPETRARGAIQEHKVRCYGKQQDTTA